MICPHCGKDINQGANGPVDVVPTFVNLNGANGGNPCRVDLVFNTANCANPFPVMSLNLAANACNPIPQVTHIKF